VGTGWPAGSRPASAWSRWQLTRRDRPHAYSCSADASALPLTALTVPFLVIGIALTAPVYAFGVRRLLGLRLPPLRTLVAGVIAVLVASPVITAIIPNKPGPLPALWFAILGYAIALLAGMTFLVVAETFVPSGSPPGPLYFARGLRKRLRWTRRYSQISRILLRRGLLPYLRGGRRSEFRTAAGRARLARSLRLALEDGRRHFRQARSGAGHPPRPAASKVRHRAERAAGRCGPSPVAGDRPGDPRRARRGGG
jgi:uncharacterized membrane protein YhaH (DUF805 family)